MPSLPRALRGAAVAAVIAPGLATAQTSPPLQQNSPVFDLGELVVQAPRLRETTPATVTRVDRALLDRLDAQRLPEALVAVPSMNLNPGNRGGSRNESAFFLRGFDQNRVPVLVDGLPIYVPYDGYLDLNRLLLGGTERIEVTHGFAPMVFGPNALGGAVNLISRRPQRRVELNSEISTELNNDGSFRGVRLSAGFGTRLERFYAQGQVSYLGQDGWNMPGGQRAGAFQPSGARLRSNSQDVRISGKIGFTPNETDEYAVGFAIQRGERGAPPYAGLDRSRATFFDWPQYDKDSVYFLSRTELPFGQGTYIRTRAYYDSFRNRLMRYDDVTYRTQRLPFAFDSSYNDFTVGGGLEAGTNPWTGATLRVAYNVKYDVHRESGPRTPQSEMRDIIHSLGADFSQRALPWLTLTGGIGYDIRSALSAQDPATGGTARFPTAEQTAFNIQAGFRAHLDERNDIFGSVARRSRFASMFERYSYRLGNGLPNPSLRPERATNLELGWEGRLAPGSTLRLSGFYSMVDDWIQTVSVGRSTQAPFNVITQSQNIGSANFYGFEAALSTRLHPALRLDANYTWMVRERANERTTPLFGTPRHRGFVSLAWDALPNLEIAPSVFAQTRQFTTDTGNRRPVSAFAVGNLRATYRVTPNVAVDVSVFNIWDQRYQYDEGFPMPGRSFRFGLRATL